MRTMLDDTGLDLLFRNARTQNGWLPAPVSDDQLRAIYQIMKVGPTSANCCPARITFLRTAEAKARLIPALSPGNVDKTRAAPVTATADPTATRSHAIGPANDDGRFASRLASRPARPG